MIIVQFFYRTENCLLMKLSANLTRWASHSQCCSKSRIDFGLRPTTQPFRLSLILVSMIVLSYCFSVSLFSMCLTLMNLKWFMACSNACWRLRRVCQRVPFSMIFSRVLAHGYNLTIYCLFWIPSFKLVCAHLKWNINCMWLFSSSAGGRFVLTVNHFRPADWV